MMMKYTKHAELHGKHPVVFFLQGFIRTIKYTQPAIAGQGEPEPWGLCAQCDHQQHQQHRRQWPHIQLQHYVCPSGGQEVSSGGTAQT